MRRALFLARKKKCPSIFLPGDVAPTFRSLASIKINHGRPICSFFFFLLGACATMIAVEIHTKYILSIKTIAPPPLPCVYIDVIMLQGALLLFF
jgi:hypothetical protein